MPRPTKTELRRTAGDSGFLQMEHAGDCACIGRGQTGRMMDDLNLRCVSATMPSRTMAGQIDVQIKGFHIMRPGPMDETHSINLIFIEDRGKHDQQMAYGTGADAVWDPGHRGKARK